MADLLSACSSYDTSGQIKLHSPSTISVHDQCKTSHALLVDRVAFAYSPCFGIFTWNSCLCRLYTSQSARSQCCGIQSHGAFPSWGKDQLADRGDGGGRSLWPSLPGPQQRHWTAHGCQTGTMACLLTQQSGGSSRVTVT